jgi:MoaA/NifB/PqqE/SkfB family radical SAM enzyme
VDIQERCAFPMTDIHISLNGNIAPCCYSENHVMGNSFKETPESIWFGKKYAELRKNRNLPACKKCVRFFTFDSLETHIYPSLYAEAKAWLADRERKHLESISKIIEVSPKKEIAA